MGNDYLDRLYEMDREDYEKMRKAYLISKDEQSYQYTERLVPLLKSPKKSITSNPHICHIL
jgi:hypothetical protein